MGCLILSGAWLAVAAAVQGVEWLWSLHLRPRRDAVYSLLRQVEAGMTKDQVRKILDVPNPPYRLRVEHEEGIAVAVPYALIEQCFAHIHFEQGRVVGLSTESESDPCAGAPEEWR